ncbi:patatin-like phospholipase family protein [Usitatibacter palustris]|uniref:PNPLA domain-containing protein n=1 Tax=Usitatibacter palustris TaxID=2732487 RepID=A0A6M4HAI0_9PROT|nr:patatin-like phospholipase family protein [Usitatibacter palustris]QJR16561.1 hypothetical protein DSM104440_03396 [Usitatibacter palustris]
MTSPLTLRAGKRALERIRTHGLDAADIAVIPGAAGGPKGLGIAGLDRAIFSEWLPAKPRTRHLVGSSIGAWRFAAACCRDPAPVLAALARGYSEQRYPPKPSARFVSDSARALLRELFEGREQEILDSPGYRLHILAVRGRGLLKRDSRFATPFGFGVAAMANMLGRRHLSHFIERTLFHDPRERPPFITDERFDAFHTHTVPLVRGNLAEALIASASIPIVLEGVAGIPDAPQGTYWDGGIIDYHLHLPYHRSEGLVLYPHFTDRIIPGWLDKPMPWRRARGEWLDNVVLVAPSREYLATLPMGKLPDRGDFKRFAHDYEARLKYWRFAIGESERLAEAFLSFARRPDPGLLLHL